MGAKNTVFFCFCGLWLAPSFQMNYKHPLSWSMRDTMRLDIPNYKIFTNAIQILPKTFNEIVCFFSMVFFLCSFFDADFCSLWLFWNINIYYIWNIKMIYWKRQNSWSCIFVNVWLSPSKKGFFFVFFNDSFPKMMENAFYFILKALFVLKIFKFLSWLFGHVEKTAWLER